MKNQLETTVIEINKAITEISGYRKVYSELLERSDLMSEIEYNDCTKQINISTDTIRGLEKSLVLIDKYIES